MTASPTYTTTPPQASDVQTSHAAPVQQTEKKKNKGLIIAAAVLGAGALFLGGAALASDSDPGQGSTSGPVVTEPAAPAPTSSPTDLTGLSANEQQAILGFEDWMGVDLTAEGERALLTDCDTVIGLYESGWSFDEIMTGVYNGTDGNSELTAGIMVAAFEHVAPQYSAEFEAWVNSL